MDHIELLYPERRMVSSAKISNWYHDAVANGQIDEDYIGISDEEWRRQAHALSDAGIITIKRGVIS